MLTLGIILLVIALLGAFIYIEHSEDAYSPLVILLIITMFWGTFLLTKYIKEKETAIKCLKGNNPYKMEIRYELQDSIYVPVDTVYIKL